MIEIFIKLSNKMRYFTPHSDFTLAFLVETLDNTEKEKIQQTEKKNFIESAIEIEG